MNIYSLFLLPNMFLRIRIVPGGPSNIDQRSADYLLEITALSYKKQIKYYVVVVKL